MRLNKLNGWERLWVVASALWLSFVLTLVGISITGDGPFSTFTERQEKTVDVPAKCSSDWPEKKSGATTRERQEEFLDRLFNTCPPGTTVIAPSKRIVQVIPEKREYNFLFAFLFASVPPILLLLISHAVMRTIKWVIAGFKRRAT